MFWYLDSAPDETGVAILAPNSRDTTWDAITGSFGPDVDFLNSRSTANVRNRGHRSRASGDRWIL
jgi:hypothetical protein